MIEMIILMAPVLIFVVPAISMWLWDMTLPELFNIKQINYWQSFRLSIIAFLSFGRWSFMVA